MESNESQDIELCLINKQGKKIWFVVKGRRLWVDVREACSLMIWLSIGKPALEVNGRWFIRAQDAIEMHPEHREGYERFAATHGFLI